MVQSASTKVSLSPVDCLRRKQISDGHLAKRNPQMASLLMKLIVLMLVIPQEWKETNDSPGTT